MYKFIRRTRTKQFSLNESIYGVSCELSQCQIYIECYFQGHWNILATIDTNRNVNSYRYHIIGASCAAIMGSYVLDPWLLDMDGVSNELWRIQDYASDLLVLHIDSTRTIKKLVNLYCNDHGKNVVTWASLLFMRARLYGVNEKYFRYGEIFMCAWSSMLQLKSFNKYTITIWTNKIDTFIKKIFLLLIMQE